MGEAFLVAFLQVLVDKLAHRKVFKYYGLIKGVDQKLGKWNDMLNKIGAVLNEAEERQLTTESEPLKLWLNDLRDLAYDVEDVLDKYATKMLKHHILQLKPGHNANASTSIGPTRSKMWNYFIPNGVFNFKMNSEIQKITDRLQEICRQKELLSLNTIHTCGSRPSTRAQQNIPPSSSQPDAPVIGREEDRRKIVELLSKQERPAVNFEVVAMVGMGGLGKTTLAGQVFNDLKSTQMFTPAVWVCVSDDFSLEKVTKKILESITFQQTLTEDFNMVQDNLRKELANKKFLIVLDDVWDTCSYGQWMKLQSPFRDGAPGSKILMTTRDAQVSQMMGAGNLVHHLKPLQNDVCLQVFEQHAFWDGNNDRPPNFEMLNEKIIAKCSGLPLAARTLGGLLRRKDIGQWEKILNRSLSNDRDILPVLRLSYHYLPSHLKRCFAYCSILPKDYEFGEMQLILLWMAEGMIQPPEDPNKKMEDLGAEYFEELLSRSLFQKSNNDNSKYVMHDLVGDLAQWAAGEICCRLEDKLDGNMQFQFPPRTRHASYLCGSYDGVKKFEPFSKVKRLRTFLPLSHSNYFDYLAYKVTSDLLPRLQYLRVLFLGGYQITVLPNSIGDLKYLRYLDLSYSKIRCLPESTTTLYNLQTLILEDCSELKALPAGLSDLINLRHLNNSGMASLKGMPLQLGRLTNLQSLPEFVVVKDSDHSRIREIGSLLHLGGTLRISRLENVIDAEDARWANLKCKDRLDSLMLEWSTSSEARDVESANVLDSLQPHGNLKKLTIKGYGGKEFSTWIRVPSFSNMVRVSLKSCENCVLLPSLGQLPCLKELYISRMGSVESVGPEFYGRGNKVPFPLLETLVFEDMQQWKKWLSFSDHDQQGNGIFPCLKRLSIRRCPKLEGNLPEKLDSLEELDIVECEELLVSSIVKYRRLHKLRLNGCKEVVHTSAVEFELLKSLHLSNISVLMRFEILEFMKGLTKVANLKITSCEDLMCSLKNDEDGLLLLRQLISLDHLVIEDNSVMVEKMLGKEDKREDALMQVPILGSKLEYLKISRCETLSNIPKGLHQLASLRELHIYQCPSLDCFPSICLPPSLLVIEIEECDSLVYFAKYDIPSNLKRIRIRYCKSLKSLIEEEVEEGVVGSSSSSSSCHHICLEELEIYECPSLASLSMGGRQLSSALKHFEIWRCKQLELIGWDGFGFELSNSSNYFSRLETIIISLCQNLGSLPEGLCHLSNLRELMIDGCGSLVSIPRLSPSLREIQITGCDNLKELSSGDDMYSLNYLEHMEIDYSIFKLGGERRLMSSWFSPHLTSLEIWQMNSNQSCKQVWKLLHLHSLTFLRELSIEGEDSDVVSFPPDYDDDHHKARENNNETVSSMETLLFPKSLARLSIRGFPNLKKLSGSSRKGFQILTSLQTLRLINCPKLATIPEEGLPLSLGELFILMCPLLAERCQHPSTAAASPNKGRRGYSSDISYWPKISHIPCIDINGGIV